MWKANKLCVSLILLGGFLAGQPKAQAQGDQPNSVADAARRAREQKKDASKPATVITNDTLEPTPSAVPAATTQPSPTNAAPGTNLAVAATPDAASTGQGAATSTPSAVAEEPPQDKPAQQSELKALKQQIAELQLQVDVAQRALSLASDDFYSRPDFSKDEEGKAKLDALKSELTEKQAALAELKAKMPAGAASDEKPAEGQTQSSAQPSSDSQPEPEPQKPQE